MSSDLIAGIIADDVTDRMVSDVHAANPGIFNEAASPPEVPVDCYQSAKTLWTGTGSDLTKWQKSVVPHSGDFSKGNAIAGTICVVRNQVYSPSEIPEALRIDLPNYLFFWMDIILIKPNQPKDGILDSMERRIYWLLDSNNRQDVRETGGTLPTRNGSGKLYDLTVPDGHVWCTYWGQIQPPEVGMLAVRYSLQYQRLIVR